ncbi:hypothetical protein F5X99DRAFT_262235 [Biscogniauxia marginata]|nr:hypothetical protein F5X99DRAFT_262235 [Biscogniauxia marginata]
MDPAAQTPALQPPPGMISNFVDPPSRASLGRIVIGVTLPLMILFLALRVYTRLSIFRTLSADDVVGHPLGPHQWDVPRSQINARLAKLTLSATCLYALGSLLVKSALLVLYLRIFHQVERARAMIWTGIVVIAVFYTITIVINIVNCVPIEQHVANPDGGEWEERKHRDQCLLPVYYLSAAQGIFSVVSDFYVLAIPMSLIVGIRIPKARKVIINLVFLTGLLACILSIISTVFRFKQLDSNDFTWDAIPIYCLRYAMRPDDQSFYEA